MASLTPVCMQECPWPPSLAHLMTSSSSATTMRRVTPTGDPEDQPLWPGLQAIKPLGNNMAAGVRSFPLYLLAASHGHRELLAKAQLVHADKTEMWVKPHCARPAATDTLPSTCCFLQPGSVPLGARAGQGGRVLPAQHPGPLHGHIRGLASDFGFSCTLSQSVILAVLRCGENWPRSGFAS